MKVINLWGGPGCGKSTTAAALCAAMKAAGLEVELVTEVAKDLVYEDHAYGLDNQLLIFAKQENRLRRLDGKVEWVITDSPLPLSIIYGRKTGKFPFNRPQFEGLVWDIFHGYPNFNFLIGRKTPYQNYGRIHTEEEAERLDWEMFEFLLLNNVPFSYVDGDSGALAAISERLGLNSVLLQGVGRE